MIPEIFGLCVLLQVSLVLVDALSNAKNGSTNDRGTWITKKTTGSTAVQSNKLHLESSQSEICSNPMPFSHNVFPFNRPLTVQKIYIFDLATTISFLVSFKKKERASWRLVGLPSSLRGPRAFSFTPFDCWVYVLLHSLLLAGNCCRVLCKSSRMPPSSRGFSPRVDERC